jgi:hypothetical protein
MGGMMKQLSKMSTAELVDYWSGYLLIEIGRGNFRIGVTKMLLATMTEASKAAEKKMKEGKRK